MRGHTAHRHHSSSRAAAHTHRGERVTHTAHSSGASQYVY